MNEVVLNPALLHELEHDARFVAVFKEHLDAGAEVARRHAPFPRIADSITTDVGYEHGHLLGRINADDAISHFWEWGTIELEPRPFMRPAASAIGAFVEARHHARREDQS